MIFTILQERGPQPLSSGFIHSRLVYNGACRIRPSLKPQRNPANQFQLSGIIFLQLILSQVLFDQRLYITNKENKIRIFFDKTRSREESTSIPDNLIKQIYVLFFPAAQNHKASTDICLTQRQIFVPGTNLIGTQHPHPMNRMGIWNTGLVNSRVFVDYTDCVMMGYCFCFRTVFFLCDPFNGLDALRTISRVLKLFSYRPGWCVGPFYYMCRTFLCKK